MCRKNNVFPKYMSLKTDNRSVPAVSAIAFGQLRWLKEEQKILFKRRDVYNIYIKAEARAEFAERSVQKLQKEVDRLEDDILSEKEKNKLLSDEMEATLYDIQNM